MPTILTAHSPVYANVDNSVIDLTVQFAEFPEPVLFRAMPGDTEPHGVELYARAALGEFGEVQPYVAPAPAVPAQVTMRQARLALLEAGLLSMVSTAINTLSSPEKERALIEWEYSSAVRRDDPLIPLLAPALGLTDEDLDALFIAAAAK